MKHTYTVPACFVPNAMEALDEQDIDYDIEGNQFTVDDDSDLLFQNCLAEAGIDYSE